MSEKVQFGRQLVPGADGVRIYHSRLRMGKGSALTPDSGAEAGMMLAVEGMMAALRGLVPAGASDSETLAPKHPLVELIESLDGVEGVVARGYSLMVVKGRQWGWDEIEPSILRALAAFSLKLPGVVGNDE